MITDPNPEIEPYARGTRGVEVQPETWTHIPGLPLWVRSTQRNQRRTVHVNGRHVNMSQDSSGWQVHVGWNAPGTYPGEEGDERPAPVPAPNAPERPPPWHIGLAVPRANQGVVDDAARAMNEVLRVNVANADDLNLDVENPAARELRARVERRPRLTPGDEQFWVERDRARRNERERRQLRNGEWPEGVGGGTERQPGLDELRRRYQEEWAQGFRWTENARRAHLRAQELVTTLAGARNAGPIPAARRQSARALGRHWTLIRTGIEGGAWLPVGVRRRVGDVLVVRRAARRTVDGDTGRLHRQWITIVGPDDLARDLDVTRVGVDRRWTEVRWTLLRDALNVMMYPGRTTAERIADRTGEWYLRSRENNG